MERDSALGEQFQQGSVDGSVYDAWRARREAVVEGAAAEQLQERFGPDRKDLRESRGEAAPDVRADLDWAAGEVGQRPGESDRTASDVPISEIPHVVLLTGAAVMPVPRALCPGVRSRIRIRRLWIPTMRR